jgi:hypothetical protein
VGAARRWRMMEGLVSLNRFAQPSRHTAIPLIGGIRVGQSGSQRLLQEDKEVWSMGFGHQTGG